MSDESKIRELSEAIRTKCIQIQQQGSTAATGSGGRQQNPPSSVASSAAHVRKKQLLKFNLSLTYIIIVINIVLQICNNLTGTKFRSSFPLKRGYISSTRGNTRSVNSLMFLINAHHSRPHTVWCSTEITIHCY